jgi:hypothetical protein
VLGCWLHPAYTGALLFSGAFTTEGSSPCLSPVTFELLGHIAATVLLGQDVVEILVDLMEVKGKKQGLGFEIAQLQHKIRLRLHGSEGL